jgi:hypothetical protein
VSVRCRSYIEIDIQIKLEARVVATVHWKRLMIICKDRQEGIIRVASKCVQRNEMGIKSRGDQ